MNDEVSKVRAMLAEADFLLHELIEALPTDTRRLVAQAVHKLVHDMSAAISDNQEIRASSPFKFEMKVDKPDDSHEGTHEYYIEESLPDDKDANTTYLGDGLYASYDEYQIKLFASDGIHTTNTVYLDGNVIVAFQQFVAKITEEAK